MKKYMSVKEMGDLLGIKKTDRYWLIKKGYFNVITLAGKMWVETESFEKWYTSQVKYHKVSGDDGEKVVDKQSYSPKEAANLLGVSEWLIYDLIKSGKLDTVKVDGWMRIPKDGFYAWYGKQDRYRIRGKDPRLSRPMPQKAEGKGNEAKGEKEKDPGRLIHIREAADLLGITTADVSRAAEEFPGLLKILDVDGIRYVTEKSLDMFFRKQNRYHYHPENDRSVVKTGGDYYLTIGQAARLARVSRPAVTAWQREGKIPALRTGRVVRIPLSGLKQWLTQREKEIVPFTDT